MDLLLCTSMNVTNGSPERGYRENLIHGRHGLCGTPLVFQFPTENITILNWLCATQPSTRFTRGECVQVVVTDQCGHGAEDEACWHGKSELHSRLSPSPTRPYAVLRSLAIYPTTTTSFTTRVAIAQPLLDCPCSHRLGPPCTNSPACI